MAIVINSNFPKYDAYNPLIPVWCITPDDKGCTHRFFDTSPISPSGRFVAVFQLPFEDRQPLPGEMGNVRIVDLETGSSQVVAETCGWEPQLGANINWGANDNELFFNDVDKNTWRPFAWKLDPLTGGKKRLEGTVYHASLDGKWLISANLSLLRKTQDGYGVAVPKHTTRRNVGLVEDDGFYLTDTSTGKCRLFVSIRTLMTQAIPSVHYEDIQKCEVYGAHCRFNPLGTRLMLSIRWFKERGPDIWNISELDYKALHFSWFTVPIKGTPIHCAAGPELFIKGGHHATWFPDGNSISMNLRLDGKSMRFVSVKYNGSRIHNILDDVRGSGHPTVHPSGHILTDTYLKSWDFPQYGDGTVPIRWINMKNGRECVLVRIHTQQPCNDSALRIDPHPAWDRTWRYIAFNGYSCGSRRVFIADMEPLLSGAIKPIMRKHRTSEKNRLLPASIYIDRMKRYCKNIFT